MLEMDVVEVAEQSPLRGQHGTDDVWLSENQEDPASHVHLPDRADADLENRGG